MRSGLVPGSPAQEFRKRRVVAHLLFAASVLGCAALLFFPPARNGFYPLCPVHQYLGVLCPGCGATRALAVLLQGRLHEALQLNALFVLLLPIALAGAGESYRRALRPGLFRWPQPHPAAVYGLLAAATVFTVARNLAH